MKPREFGKHVLITVNCGMNGCMPLNTKLTVLLYFTLPVKNNFDTIQLNGNDNESFNDICGEDLIHSGLCKLRLRENILEKNRLEGTRFQRVIPARQMCSERNIPAFTNAGYFTNLDRMQCDLENRYK